jgi:hypothetical protein
MQQHFIDSVTMNDKTWTEKLRLAVAHGQEEWLRAVQWVDENSEGVRRWVGTNFNRNIHLC